MKVILVARNAFAAYLVSSAVTATREYDGGLIKVKGLVNFRNNFAGPFVVRTDYDAVRKLEVADRRALTQKFGIRGDGNISRRDRFAYKCFHFVASSNWLSRLRYYHGEAVHCGTRNQSAGEGRRSRAGRRAAATVAGCADSTVRMPGSIQWRWWSKA